uniref:Secreted protein n=1 Tax=Oryza punctata TaxID=4537 RepID=A0A0E0M543_ORYPU
MMRAASLSCLRPCMLRGVTVCAALAARATVRFARRLAVGSVTGGLTLSDILLDMTMTEDDLSPELVPAPAQGAHRRRGQEPQLLASFRQLRTYDKLPTKRTLAAADVASGGNDQATCRMT